MYRRSNTHIHKNLSRGGKSRNPHGFDGYTIIEVLIFVAISGFMFIVAAIFISGKQANVEFRQGVTDAATQIRTTVNEVANGEYNSVGNFKCTATAGNLPVFSTTSVDQGANGGSNGCIFLGKVIQLDTGGDPTALTTYTVAAHQLDSSGQAVTNFGDALPGPIVGVPSGTPDLTDRKKLQDGLVVTKMLKCDAGDTDCTSGKSIGAFGFFGSFGNYSTTTSGELQSGAQAIVTAAIPTSTMGEPEKGSSGMIKTLQDNLQTIDGSDTLHGGSYILLCFKNGTKAGSVIVGGNNGQQFTVTPLTGGLPAAC